MIHISITNLIGDNHQDMLRLGGIVILSFPDANLVDDSRMEGLVSSNGNNLNTFLTIMDYG